MSLLKLIAVANLNIILLEFQERKKKSKINVMLVIMKAFTASLVGCPFFKAAVG